MAKIIKLENIEERGYDRIIGKPVEEFTIKYVCEACRHLVSVEDKFCWQCGEPLGLSDLVEHYYKGERLIDKEYKRRRDDKYTTTERGRTTKEI